MDDKTGNSAIEGFSFDQIADVEAGPIIWALVIALLLVVGLWIFKNYLLPLFTRDLAPQRVARFRQRITVAAWLFYIGLLVWEALRANPLISGVLLGIVLAVGWNLWRDMVEGAIFKLQARATVGDNIVVAEHEGVIEKAGVTASNAPHCRRSGPFHSVQGIGKSRLAAPRAACATEKPEF